MKKFLLYLVVFFSIGTIVTIFVLYNVDKYIYSLSNSETEIKTASKQNSMIALLDKKESTPKIVIPNDAKDLEYSYNNKYYTYLSDSKIYINNIKDGKNVTVIEEDNPICYCTLLYDKNLILYFTQSVKGTTSTLVLKTYNIDNEVKSSYNKFVVNNFSCIKDMHMSPVINIIYINVETKNGNKANNIIYRIDLFNSMSTVKSGLIVNKMLMLQNKDMVYYEDVNSNIYYGSQKLRAFKEDVEMIGIDENDALYFLSSKNKNKVYKVVGNKIKDTIELEDTNIVTTYTNNKGVYIIYKDYVINVTSSNPLKKIGRLSEYVKFEAIKANKMYMRTADNTLISVDIKE